MHCAMITSQNLKPVGFADLTASTALDAFELYRFRWTESAKNEKIYTDHLKGRNINFGPNSDVDVLVEFKAGTRVGLIRLTKLEFELGEIIGRKVDLNTPGFISRYFHSDVMAAREVQYAEA